MPDHTRLYGQLRNALLARCFALNRNFRANLFSDRNTLEHTGDAQSILAAGVNDQNLYRWHIERHGQGGGNPLLFTGQLLICLAVEHALGRADALPIIDVTLKTLASLYKFTGNHFDGYIIRHDAVTSDAWATKEQNGKPVPQYCTEIPIGQDGKYIYCIRLDDPRYMRNLSTRQRQTMSPDEQAAYESERWTYTVWRWVEPSMDELCGLLAGYALVFQLVDGSTPRGASVRAEVRRQVSNLADYLAAHGYLLVRPAGGFSANGASGALPAMEFPYNQVFKRITGQDFSARVDFIAACQQADVWKALEGPIGWWTVGGIVAGAALVALRPALEPLALATETFLALLSTVTLARAVGLYVHREAFDVYNDNQATEFAGAYLLTMLPTQQRFELWMSSLRSMGTGCTGNFPPYLGITALDDPNLVVRNAYLSWLPERRSHPALDANYANGFGAQTAWASAVAVVLGAGSAEEATLITKLDALYNEFQNTWQANIPVRDDPPHPYEDSLYALEYMTALALAWLHAKRQADKGTPVATPGFPTVPNPALWPNPGVPQNVVDAAMHLDPGWRMILPVEAIQGTMPPHIEDNAAPLFPASGIPVKPAEPTPILPPPASPLKFDQSIMVSESDGDVDTGVSLQNGDDYAFQATGKIWAGVAFTGTNGPRGWDNIEYDTKFPLHGVAAAHPYCLLGKIKNYFFIGDGLSRTRFILDPSFDTSVDSNVGWRLYLRINDDAPGNGDGYFLCRVQVWGTPVPPPPALQLHVEPASIPPAVAVSVTVSAVDKATHQPVTSGTVKISGVPVGTLGVPFSYVFRRRRVGRLPDVEFLYPSGAVSAPGYPTTLIPFGFSTEGPPALDVIVPQASIAIGARTSIRVHAQDGDTQETVPARVKIDGQDVGSTDSDISYIFHSLTSAGVVSAPPYVDVPVHFNLVPGSLTVSVSQASPPLNSSIQFTVYARNSAGEDVPGTVILHNFDGTGNPVDVSATTNTSFPITLCAKRVRKFDTELRKYYYETTYPSGTVQANGYLSQEVPFVWPT